jgi:hypothetical protein
MIAQPASTLLVQVFGDTPIKIAINSVLVALVGYWFWRIVLKPLMSIAINIKSQLIKTELGVLEIIPPKILAVMPQHTQNLFSVLQHQLGKYDTLSLEIIGTKHNGIKYRAVAAKRDIPTIQKHLASYMPNLTFKQGADLPELKKNMRIYSIRQSRHFAYPLKPHEAWEESDPIAFIAGSMTRLHEDEEVTLQLVLRRYASPKSRHIRNKLLGKGYVMVDRKLRYYLQTYSWVWIPAVTVGLLTRQWQIGTAIALVLWVSSLFAERTERQLTNLEEQLVDSIARKLEQPLLVTDMRLGISSPNRTGFLADEFMSALGTLNTEGFQRLRLARPISLGWYVRYIHNLFIRRRGSLLSFNSSVLSASELTTLFHFPHGVIRTEGVVRSHSRVLPAPVSLQGNPKLDNILGLNKYHGGETPIGLTEAERERHIFVVGGTGSGKTTMLKYQIVQDIQNGKGIAVVDPHGDLAEELLEFIPKERKKDLIYLNPDDLDHPIGVNLLELPEGLSGNDLLREKDRVTESVISVMRKVFSDDDTGGHRIEYILRNTIHTAFTTENPTLFTIFRLLNDGKYAKKVINNLADQDLKAFWKNELGKAGSMQKVKMAAGITAKIGRFLFSASARAMLEQEKSSIDFNEILDGKILICNFSKGRLGEDTSTLFGVTILAKLQLAALKRSEQKQSDRKPFYLYVDEFQNFATISFTQLLSEARKYKVYLTMAEQSTQQQDDQKLVNIILANVGTVVTFRTGSPKDEELLLPLFEPYIEKGEISNLSAYNFYCRITSIDAQEPMSGETIVLDVRR